MPETTNFNIPFLDGTELVRDYPTFSEDLANAVDAGLVLAGGLVAVKSVLKTDIFSASVDAGDNVAVTDLSITHEVSDPANKLIISAFFGVAGNTKQDSNGRGEVGIAVDDGTGLIAVGANPGDRTAVTAGGAVGTASNIAAAMPSVTYVHTPGAGSKTYQVVALGIFFSGTETLFINRVESDSNFPNRPRGVSSLVIQEVAV